MPTQPLHCPHCRYDLTGATGEVCPECGERFSRAVLESRAVASIRFALGLVGYGALAVVAAWSVGSAFTWLPYPRDGSGPNAEMAARMLDVVPRLVAAAGVGVLGAITGRTALQRWWVVVVAGIAALVVLGGVTGWDQGWNDRAPMWLQPQGWGLAGELAHGVVLTLLALGAARGLARVSGVLGHRLAGRVAGALSVVAIAGLVVFLGSYFWGVYAESIMNPATRGGLTEDWVLGTWAFRRLLEATSALLSLGVWMGLGVTALWMRAVWAAGAVGLKQA
jgi:hypothetical protein